MILEEAEGEKAESVKADTVHQQTPPQGRKLTEKGLILI